MKKSFISPLVIGTIMSIGAVSPIAVAKTVTTQMTVKPIIAMSEKADNPAVNDSTKAVTFEFSAPLNSDKISSSVKLYRVKSTGAQVEEPAIITIDKSKPMLLNIARKNGSKFAEGEEYKIAISKNIKSTNGMTLKKDFAGYFATNYSFNLGNKGITELNGTRSLIICISDIHLGPDLAYSEFNKNSDAFVDFLNKIRLSPNVKELVIAGDLIDEWFIPAQVDTFNGKTQADFVKTVAASHKAVVDAFKNIIKDGKVKVTYVPGNHDILITAKDIQSILPGISQARDVRGLGKYSPLNHPEIAIEHGHRYNFFCAPDPISNRSITKTDSILPPGYFFTRIATASVVESAIARSKGLVIPPVSIPAVTSDNDNPYFLYWQILKNILTDLPIQEGFNAKIIKTNIDGFTADYAMSDVFPSQKTPNGPIDVTLYKGMAESWDKRQKLNMVPVHIPVKTAIKDAAAANDLDEKSESQYFKNAASDKRIVVFGHSHAALVQASVNTKSQKTIYANSGTWIDRNKGNTTMDFVVITPPKANAATEYVNLYTYSEKGNITRLPNPQAITKLKK